MQVINNNEAANRFEMQIAGQTAFLTYKRSGDSITFLHTEVPESIREQGIGSELARPPPAHATPARHILVFFRDARLCRLTSSATRNTPISYILSTHIYF